MNQTELFEKMQTIVDENVESYKSDFDIDKETMVEWKGNWWAVWVVRDHGTQLQRFTNALESMSYIDAVFSSMEVKKLYIIRKGTDYSIIESSYDEVRKLYKEMDKYIVEIYGMDNYTYSLRKTEGAFNDEEAANKTAEWLMYKMNGKSYRVTRKDMF